MVKMGQKVNFGGLFLWEKMSPGRKGVKKVQILEFLGKNMNFGGKK